MSLATFKDLCIDACDAWSHTDFWAGVLGLEPTHEDNGDGHLTGPTPSHTIWINRVPEPKAVKHRVHLDVGGISGETLVDLGAVVVDDAETPRPEWVTWSVYRDPEHGEFCLFPGGDPQSDADPFTRLRSIVFDCVDHVALAQWWATILGGRFENHDGHFCSVESIDGAPFERLSFVPVPEPKTVKNRIHLDLFSKDLAGVLASGAKLLRARDDEIRWTVLADPEGNEFCVFGQSD